MTPPGRGHAPGCDDGDWTFPVALSYEPVDICHSISTMDRMAEYVRRQCQNEATGDGSRNAGRGEQRRPGINRSVQFRAPSPSSGDRPSMVELALSYAELGWKVFPLGPGSKRPRFKKGHQWGNGVLSATTDPHEIRDMWGAGGANCNIGIATGPDSNLFVIDVDSLEHRTDVDGCWREPDLLHVLELRWWPPTMRIATPNGRHVYFRYPPDLSGSEYSSLRSRSKDLFSGVDHRGSGGYVVGPGSIVDGVTYQFIDAGELAEVPREVVHVLAVLGSEPRAIATSPGMTVPSEESVSFAELWSEKGVTLVPGEHTYKCPFHPDGKPSLAINTEKQQWICHGCGEEGGYRGLWSKVRPGVSLPGASGQIDLQTLAVLRRCEDMFAGAGSVGSTGTDVKVYRALLDAASKRGSLEVGASLRWLGEEASCGFRTAGDALARLEGQGVIQLVSQDGPRSQTGQFRIRDPGSLGFAFSAQSYSQGGGIEEVEGIDAFDGDDDLLEVVHDRDHEPSPSQDLSHDAYRWGALSSVIRTLHYLEQVKKATAKEIQQALGDRSLSAIHRHLMKLKASGRVIQDGSTYAWAGATTEDLDSYAQMSGTAGRGELAKTRHALDRLGREEAVARLQESMVLSGKRAKERAMALVPDEETGETVLTFPREEAVRLGYFVELGDSRLVDAETGAISDAVQGHRWTH